MGASALEVSLLLFVNSFPRKTASQEAQMAVDTEKLNAFLGQFVGDLGAAVHAGMVVIGEKLGLYKALAKGAMTSAELAAKTGTDERYLRE